MDKIFRSERVPFIRGSLQSRCLLCNMATVDIRTSRDKRCAGVSSRLWNPREIVLKVRCMSVTIPTIYLHYTQLLYQVLTANLSPQQ